MNATTAENMSWADKFKWGLVVILLIAGIITNSLFIKIAVALRLVAWIALVAALIFIAYHTQKGKSIWGFIQESQIELRKVIWPTRQETIQTTLVIALMVTVMALILWGVDS